MRNRMYGGVRGRKTKVGEKLLRFPPTRFDLLEIFTECAVIAMVFHGAGPAALCLDWLFSCVVGVSLSYLLECQYASLA